MFLDLLAGQLILRQKPAMCTFFLCISNPFPSQHITVSLVTPTFVYMLTQLPMQVLFFIPGIRKAMLSITPDPAKEFSLSCEMSLLFRMLYTARGNVCQASNLFRSTCSSVGPDKPHLHLLLLSCSCAMTEQDTMLRSHFKPCVKAHLRDLP